MNVFITGIAGFIGSTLAHSLVKDGHRVWGIDSLNPYYDVGLKRKRLENLLRVGVYTRELDLAHPDVNNYAIANAMTTDGQTDPCTFDAAVSGFITPDIVVHLAAYAGVRHSLAHPHLYIQNITGTQKLIDALSWKNQVQKVVYASTSCVMAGNELPWNEDAKTSHQLNPYGWSKHVNECQFKSSKLRNTLGLRFFTVYGPWGRPDMALFQFTENILAGKPITLFNNGEMKRDWTYVDDIVKGIKLTMFSETKNGDIYNIGRGDPVDLEDFVGVLEARLGKKAIIEYAPRHPADTLETFADVSKLKSLGYAPDTNVEQGVKRFVEWYRNYYNVF